MKASELIEILKQNPDADVIFWDGEDNWNIDHAEVDSFNSIEIVLTNKHLI